MVNNDWDLIDLRIFCAVARRSSFVAAANELGISPAYVSKRVASFEQALGVTLLHRTTRRVHVSDEGERVYAQARAVLEAAEAVTQQLASARAAPSGPLRVATSLRLGRHHVAPLLSQLQKRHPALEIWLELIDRRIDLIGEGFDLDIRVGEVHEPHLVARPVVRGARVLVAAPAYLKRRGRPKTLAELARHDCLLFRDRDQSFGVWRLDGPHGTESVKVTGPLGSNHSDIVHQWALAGHGIVLVSGWDIAPRLADGSVERVLPGWRQAADVWAVTPTRLAASPKLRTCVDFVARGLARGPHALDTGVT